MKGFMKVLFTLLGSMLWFLPASGQTDNIQALERKLRNTYGDDLKVLIEQILRIDSFNVEANEAIVRKMSSTSIDSFYTVLVARHPKSTSPYILRAELLHHEYWNSTAERMKYIPKKVSVLHKALMLDSTSTEALALMAEVFYKDFLYPRKVDDLAVLGLDSADINEYYAGLDTIPREPLVSFYAHAADSALSYFYKLWLLDSTKKDEIYFPIRQLECFLNISNSVVKFDMYAVASNCYFPSWYFANLKENWQCDSTKDYLSNVYLSKRYDAGRLKEQLNNLEEPCLYNAAVPKGDTIFRFTWLRSFHHPVSVRIENIKGMATMYWKVGKGAGGYQPIGIKKSRQRKLKTHEWSQFVALVKDADFDTLPNGNYVVVLDGANWTLERKSTRVFKAHRTNVADGSFKKACLYLLKLTKMRIKKEYIY